MIRWRADGYEVAFTTRIGGVSDGPYASLNLGRKSGDDVERVDENRILALQRRSVALAKAQQVPSRALDVGEQQGDGALWQPGHNGAHALREAVAPTDGYSLTLTGAGPYVRVTIHPGTLLRSAV